jgi:hypothetical protein
VRVSEALIDRLIADSITLHWTLSTSMTQRAD